MLIVRHYKEDKYWKYVTKLGLVQLKSLIGVLFTLFCCGREESVGLLTSDISKNLLSSLEDKIGSLTDNPILDTRLSACPLVCNVEGTLPRF